jgi:cytochrome c oxidase subunit II
VLDGSWRRLGVAPTLLFSVVLAACGGGTDDAPADPTSAAESPSGSPPAGDAATAERGEALARELGCAACHSADGSSSVGPTWQGLFGRTRPLADGSEVTADEAYIRESIVDPNAKVAEGFSPGIMPQDFGERLSDDDIRSLIEYIISLDGE